MKYTAEVIVAARTAAEKVGVGIPTGRSISPISGTNWEGIGVIPDIAVPQEEAFNVAHIAALRQVLVQCNEQHSNPMRALREEAQEALSALEAAR